VNLYTALTVLIRIVRSFLCVIWNVACAFFGRLLMLCRYFSSTLFVETIQTRFSFLRTWFITWGLKIDVQIIFALRHLWCWTFLPWISILKLNRFQLFVWNGFFILRIFLGSATRCEPWPLLILEFSEHHSLAGRICKKGAQAVRITLSAQKHADALLDSVHRRSHTSWPVGPVTVAFMLKVL
jgi:hypothetical protein